MCKKHNIAAVVLAAGYSSRMGDFKPLLPFGASTVIERVIQNFKQAGIMNIIVVVGNRADELIPVLDKLSVRHIINENYDAGMFSSIQKGVQMLPTGTDAFFLLPADMPLVKSHTIRRLSRAFNKAEYDVIYPVFQQQRGHPPLITTNCFSEILTAAGNGGLRQILALHDDRAYEIEVLDEGITLDLDTHEDYQKLNIEYNRRVIPTTAECDAILVQMDVPEAIIKHGRVVADVACKLAKALKQHGLRMDVDAVIVASRLHDIAKGKPNHAQLGARSLRKYGYDKVAKIVAAHTDLEFGDDRLLDEMAVVYLADKFVKGECIVSLQERFSKALEKYTDNIEVISMIRQRQLIAEQIEKEIERLLGESIKNIIAAPCSI